MTNHPDPNVELVERPEPVELMVRALHRAAEDCDGARAGGQAPAGRNLLRRAESIRAVAPLSSHYRNPAALVAERLSLWPRELAVTAIGGNAPQLSVNRTALAIGRGELEVAVVLGADCVFTTTAARKHPDRPVLPWTTQTADTEEPVLIGTERRGATEAEEASGIDLPIHVFPLFENALRAEAGRSLDKHQQRLGDIWSRFSQVASRHPNAWLTEPRSAEDLVTVTEANRMVSYPYTKLLTANMQVDQGAALIMCSAEAAEAAGVPRDRWVFPLAGSDANDHWFLSHRANFHSSPAMRLCGRSALAQVGIDIDDVAHLDLYSCFPSVVQIVADELGISVDDPRPLTVTGGLTFFGGPGNNYSTHAIATMVDVLREDPGSLGVVTGLGWYLTKHSIGVYGTDPGLNRTTPDAVLDATASDDAVSGRAVSGRAVSDNVAVETAAGFRWTDPQAAVGALPQCAPDADAQGEVTVETYTVIFDRDNAVERGVVACRTPEGRRAWATVTDPDQLAMLVTEEGCGLLGKLRCDGQVDLR